MRRLIPWVLSSESSCRWATSAIRVHSRSLLSLATPPFSATRSAIDGERSTTSTRWPTSTAGCPPPTSPRHDEASEASERCFVSLTPNPSTSPVAASARIARAASESRRKGIERKITRRLDRLAVSGRRGDHRGVVGAERERRRGRGAARRPQLGVRRHAADDGDPLGARLLGGLERPRDERAHDRPLVARGQIGTPRLELVPEPAHLVQQCGLHAREREVEPRHARDREVEGLGVALAREPVDLRPARIAEPEQARALVERLAGRVVERGPERLEGAVLAHVHEQRVPAASEQAEKRRLERLRL